MFRKFASLSKGYIYIFQNTKDNQAETYYWVKNSDVQQISEYRMNFEKLLEFYNVSKF